MTFLFLEEGHSGDYGTRGGSACKSRTQEGDLYQSNLALFEVSPSVIINQDETEVVASGEFLVDVFESRSEVESAEKETDWDGFASNRSPVHDFEFGDGF